MRLFTIVAFVLLPLSAVAQAPDVRVKLDAVINGSSDENGKRNVRLYDRLGNRGVLALTFYLEPGFRTYVTQRLQQIENDPDKSPLDEYYVEDEGLWRVGKQYLPFGSGKILRESVLAVRGDTNLIIEGLPVAAAACDGGVGRQRGFVARVGSRIGLSVAYGHHFGIASTALNYVRTPEESPGKGRGYQAVFGVDGYRTFGRFTVAGEAVILRRGETSQDVDEDVLDGSVLYRPIKTATMTAGVTHSESQDRTYLRVMLSCALDRHSTIEPLVRFTDGRIFDASVSLRVRF